MDIADISSRTRRIIVNRLIIDTDVTFWIGFIKYKLIQGSVIFITPVYSQIFINFIYKLKFSEEIGNISMIS